MEGTLRRRDDEAPVSTAAGGGSRSGELPGLPPGRRHASALARLGRGGVSARVKVPFLDLRAQDAVIGAAVRAALEEVLTGQHFVLGPQLGRFEAAMASYCGVRHALGVGSGTDALALALTALRAGPARGVTTPSASSRLPALSCASVPARVSGRRPGAEPDPRRSRTRSPVSGGRGVASCPCTCSDGWRTDDARRPGRAARSLDAGGRGQGTGERERRGGEAPSAPRLLSFYPQELGGSATPAWC